jgi:hypothetical protein
VSEGNICIKHVWRKHRVALGSLLTGETVSRLRREALSSPEKMYVLGREVLKITAALVNQHTGTPNLLRGNLST